MARINFDDNVESQPEFKRLVGLCASWDEALGMLVRFFRLAQQAYGRGQGVTAETLETEGLGAMLKSGWAIPFSGDTFQAKGAEKHFAWYVQKIEAGKKGGRPVNREVSENNRTVSAANRSTVPANPLSLALAPALSPALAPVIKKENAEKIAAPLQAQVAACAQTWGQTLTHMGTKRAVGPTEELAITRAIQAHGAEMVDLALFGARFEKATDNFNPKDHVSIGRVLERDKFGKLKIDKFANLGARAKQTQPRQPARAEEPPPVAEEYYTKSPEEIRALMSSIVGGLPKGGE